MGIRVLIVDDHRVVAEGLRYVIDAEPDLEVVGSAADGREALRQVEEIKPDVVLMDISMPELNGIEATELILKRAPQVKIVILSTYSNRERVWRAFQAGARAYVPKKATAKEVVDAIRSVREGGRFLSQEIAQVVIEDFLRNQPPTSALDLLSSRERQVLQLLVEGKSGAVIAQTLFLSPKTVDTYRSRIMKKLNIGKPSRARQVRDPARLDLDRIVDRALAVADIRCTDGICQDFLTYVAPPPLLSFPQRGELFRSAPGRLRIVLFELPHSRHPDGFG